MNGDRAVSGYRARVLCVRFGPVFEIDQPIGEVALMNGRDVLRRAAEIVERGWVRGHMRRGDSYCAVGALRVAAFGDVRKSGGRTCEVEASLAYREALMLLANRVRLATSPHAHEEPAIIGWNDHYSGGRARVAETMRETAWIDPEFKPEPGFLPDEPAVVAAGEVVSV